MVYAGIGEEEHLVFSVITENGVEVDDDIVNRILELPAEIAGRCPQESAKLIDLRARKLNIQQQMVEEANRRYFLEECEKLDAFSEDLKTGLQHDINELKKAIRERKKEFKASTNLTLEQMLNLKDEINKMEVRRKKMEREYYLKEDEIDAANERLQDEIRAKLQGQCSIEHIMTISFEIV